MTILDPTSKIGKMRLRCGDFSDLPIMPDEVYQSALDDCNGNLPRACVLVCTYILATLTGQTHQKLAQVEVFGAEWFQNYLQFVKLTIKNPNLMPYTPMPYMATTKDECGHEIEVPLIQFQKDWNALFASGTDTQQTRQMASFAVPYF